MGRIQPRQPTGRAETSHAGVPWPAGMAHDAGPPSSSGEGGLRGGSRASRGGTFPSGGQSRRGESCPRRKRADGLPPTSWRKAEKEKSHVSPFSGFPLLLPPLLPVSTLPQGAWPYPRPRGSDATFTGLEEAVEGSRGAARPGGWSSRSPSLLPVPPAGPILRTSLRSASPRAGASTLRWLGVPREGVRTPRRSGRSRREGHGEGCLAAGEGLKRNYSLHKNIHSSQGP